MSAFPNTFDVRPRSRHDASTATLMIGARSTLLEAGVVSLLADIPELVLVACANDPAGIIDSVVRHTPDVLLLDHGMTSDVHALATKRGMDLTESGPRVLLISTRQHPGTESTCAADRACGFVREQSPLPQIRSALRTVGACGAPRIWQGPCGSCPLRASIALPRLGLSDREYQVFDRIGRGHGTQQIALELGVSVKTVETHREGIKQKLRLESASALAESAGSWRRGDFAGERLR
jgi:DNA-binding NarL/FixJ family response regulator